MFEAALIMLDSALPGQLRIYKMRIRQLSERFPRDWGTVSKLDESMRSERWGGSTRRSWTGQC